MSRRAGPPLTRTSLNLFSEDVDKLRAKHGQGWTEAVRDLVHSALKNLRQTTIGDLYTDELEDD